MEKQNEMIDEVTLLTTQYTENGLTASYLEDANFNKIFGDYLKLHDSFENSVLNDDTHEDPKYDKDIYSAKTVVANLLIVKFPNELINTLVNSLDEEKYDIAYMHSIIADLIISNNNVDNTYFVYNFGNATSVTPVIETLNMLLPTDAFKIVDEEIQSKTR